MQSFTERMAQGKDLAQVRRDRGQHTGKSAAGWSYKRAQLTGLDMVEAYYQQWRKDVSINAYLAVEYALLASDFDDLAREIGL